MTLKTENQCGNSLAGVQSLRRRGKGVASFVHGVFLKHLSVLNIISLFLLSISVALIVIDL